MMQDMNEQTSLQMNEEKIEFISNGLLLRGIVRLPSGLRDGEKRPAVIVLHGFGSNKSAENVLGPCGVLGSLGYITLRFDMSGCGESAGPRGNLICLEQVQNTRDAVTFLSAHPFVEEGRIALIGSSFGAAIGIYTGAVDERVAAVVDSIGLDVSLDLQMSALSGGQAARVGLAGLALSYPVVQQGLGRWIEENQGATIPYFRIEPATLALAFSLAVALSMLAAALPAWRASRLTVTEALRRLD